MIAMLTLCAQLTLNQAIMPSPNNPEGFQTTVVSWQKMYAEVQSVLRQGLGQYRRLFSTDDPLKFSQEDRDCLEAQLWLGNALFNAIGSPEHLKPTYDENVKRAKNLVDDKCRNGRGGNGQRLFVQWTVDLTEANRGEYTRPAPQTVRIIAAELTLGFLMQMVDEYRATNYTMRTHPERPETNEEAALAAKRAAVLFAFSRMFVAIGGHVDTTVGMPAPRMATP